MRHQLLMFDVGVCTVYIQQSLLPFPRIRAQVIHFYFYFFHDTKLNIASFAIQHVLSRCPGLDITPVAVDVVRAKILHTYVCTPIAWALERDFQIPSQ